MALPIDAMALRSKPTASTIAIAGGRAARPAGAPSAEPPAQGGRELADLGHLLAQPGRGIEAGVGRAGGREQRGHAHQPVAGPPEHRLGGDRERGAAGLDHLVDRERAEHPERDGDVDDGRDAERQVHRPGQLPGGSARSLAVNVTTPKPRNAKKVSATLETMSLHGG